MAISPVFFIGLICLLGRGSFFPVVEAIWLNVPNSGERCIYEQIQANVVAVADYVCVEQDNYASGYTLDVRVTSPLGKELYKTTNVTDGQFAFTTSENGLYVACISLHHDQSHHALNAPAIVGIEWRMGIGTKDWKSVAKKEKIEGVELQLKKSVELAGALKANQIYIKHKEAILREMNEKTNERVNQFGQISLGVTIVLSLIQVWYLKHFFLRKKLI